MRRITLIAICLAFIVSQAPALAQEDNSSWVEVNGDQTPLVLAADNNCQWGPGAPAQINLPGMCGRSATTRNAFMIYSHNTWCDRIMCHYDLAQGGVFAWGALPVGYLVKLSVNGHLYRGTVIEVIRDAGSRGIDGNTEFDCPTGQIGSLTTCADLRPSYVVVRIAYIRIR